MAEKFAQFDQYPQQTRERVRVESYARERLHSVFDIKMMKQISENRSLWSSLSPRVRSCGEAEVDGLKTKIKDRTKTVDNIARYL